MTTEQLITKAEKWLKDETGNNCSNLSLKQAAKAMAYFHQHLLQQTDCSTQLPPSDFELERLYEWIMDENRRPANTAFTSGLLRKVADEIGFRLWRQLS